jgi:hypothetical protein
MRFPAESTRLGVPSQDNFGTSTSTRVICRKLRNFLDAGRFLPAPLKMFYQGWQAASGHIGIGDAFGETGSTFLGVTAAERIPAVTSVNTAARNTFFTVFS